MRYHVSLPKSSAHSNHPLGPEAIYAQKMHPKVAQRIEEMVSSKRGGFKAKVRVPGAPSLLLPPPRAPKWALNSIPSPASCSTPTPDVMPSPTAAISPVNTIRTYTAGTPRTTSAVSMAVTPFTTSAVSMAVTIYNTQDTQYMSHRCCSW